MSEGLPYTVTITILAKTNNGRQDLEAQLTKAITEHCPDINQVTSITVSRGDENETQ